MGAEMSDAPLTVERLIEILGQQPSDALVLVPGYEGGLNAAVRTSAGPVRQSEEGWYYGEWWPARDFPDGPIRAAVLLIPAQERLAAGFSDDCDLESPDAG